VFGQSRAIDKHAFVVQTLCPQKLQPPADQSNTCSTESQHSSPCKVSFARVQLRNLSKQASVLASEASNCLCKPAEDMLRSLKTHAQVSCCECTPTAQRELACVVRCCSARLRGCRESRAPAINLLTTSHKQTTQHTKQT
jgi:hypothetical protein